MFKLKKIEALLLLALIIVGSFSCKKSAVSPKVPVKLVNDSITKNGLTIIFINKDTTFQLEGDNIRKGYENTVFTTYPKVKAFFNPDALSKVIILIDPRYNDPTNPQEGVAGIAADTIHVNPRYSLANPTDLNVMVHEITHQIQAYPGGGPGYITEGIADYSRWKFGVADGFNGWYLSDYVVTDKYTDGYTVIARFILWAEAKYNKPMVQVIDKQMRDGTYDNDATWTQLTGSTFLQLWDAYTLNPYY